MYLVIERMASRHEPPCPTGCMAAGNWPRFRRIPRPKLGKPYELRLENENGGTTLFYTNLVTTIQGHGFPKVFSTEFADYRLDLRKSAPTEFVVDPD